MNENERRWLLKHEIETAVLFRIGDRCIPATMIDYSNRGVSVICEEEVAPGTEVEISIQYIEDYTIYGTVRWANSIQERSKNLYHIGMRADIALVLSETADHGFYKRYKLIKDLFPDLEMQI